MKVIVREVGDRPYLLTQSRINAPQGAKALADILADRDFADLCTINIDWVGDGFTSVLNIHTIKWYIKYSGQALTSDWNIDLEDAFGQDNIDRGMLLQIASTLEDLFHEKEAQRENG